ncbi:hypothetical protein HK105_208241 [Polyrhizophydium stewartii]|uniref:Ankyrin repeat protein n=1 Tax=Polyrhizophydium stewartii TaxID=2732419 RepID=A0ABR4MYE8_9FUNG
MSQLTLAAQGSHLLARIDAGERIETRALDDASCAAVWQAAFASEWAGDLRKLPRAARPNLPWGVYACIRTRAMCDRVAALDAAARSASPGASSSGAPSPPPSSAPPARQPAWGHAAALAMVAVRRCWLDRVPMTDPDQLAADAAWCGGLGLIRLLVDDRKLVVLHDDHATSAAAGGDMPTIEWFDAKLGGRWPPQALDAAAASGHLDAVAFLHARGAACTTRAMDDAAANGHLPVVVFLHNNRPEGCTVAAMNRAAAHGHLEVVEFLHNNRSEGCTTAAMDGAAGNGHLAVVEFLDANRLEGCTTAAMDRAAGGNHSDTVEWLFANRTEGCSPRAVIWAAAAGNAHLVEWFHVHMGDQFRPAVMDAALRRGHLGIAKWLHLHRTEGCSPQALERAAESGQVECVRWMLENISKVEWDVVGVLDMVGPRGLAPSAQIYGLVSEFAENRRISFGGKA